MLMIVSVFAVAQNPWPWNNGNFPMKLYKINPVDNKDWYQTGDSIYSIYKIGDVYYANAVKWSKSSVGFAMAFANDDDIPVKNGFTKSDSIYWGRCRGGVITQLKTISFSGEYATFVPLGVITVKDNLYYSMKPIWPEITEFLIDKPITSKALKFYQFMPGYSKLTPQWTTGYFTPELSETTAKLTLSKGRNGIIFLNACTVRFSKQDVAKGYFYLTIKAEPLKNSDSNYKSKKYKIYWLNE